MDLDGIRKNIDEIDGRMRELFLQRMELSRQVMEEKKKSGAPVYAAQREQEILNLRAKGAGEELDWACRAFFSQLTGISRLFQYAGLAEGASCLRGLPAGEGEARIRFSRGKSAGKLAACLNAAEWAGLSARQVRDAETDGACRIALSGDFSSGLARAAVLAILSEQEGAGLESAV